MTMQTTRILTKERGLPFVRAVFLCDKARENDDACIGRFRWLTYIERRNGKNVHVLTRKIT